MADEPTHWELSRRIDAQDKRLEQGLANISSRLDELPSEKTLLALLATRDAQNQALADDVRAVERQMNTERIAREQSIAAERASWDTALREEKQARQNEAAAVERRSTNARNLALTAVGLVLTLVLGVVGFLNGMGGAA